MSEREKTTLHDGDHCHVSAGAHKGKAGTVRDIKWSKSGNVTITVVQANGVRFKTLGRNVSVVAHSRNPPVPEVM